MGDAEGVGDDEDEEEIMGMSNRLSPDPSVGDGGGLVDGLTLGDVGVGAAGEELALKVGLVALADTRGKP